MDSAFAIRSRFGEQLARRFGVLLPAGRHYRRRLGLSSGAQCLIDQLLYHHTSAAHWPSLGQALLASELGVSRPTVSGQLQQLRKKGLVATRPDPRHGTRAKTLFYCLDPYLAVLAMLEGNDGFDLDVWTEGNQRLQRFIHAVDSGKWVWEVGGLRVPSSPVAEVLQRFLDAYGVSDRFAPPPALAVTASQFLSEEDVSVLPTEVDSHISTSGHEELETLELKELKTPRYKQLQTSQLKTVSSQLVTPTGEQPETSADHDQHEDLAGEEQAIDWISKQ